MTQFTLNAATFIWRKCEIYTGRSVPGSDGHDQGRHAYARIGRDGRGTGICVVVLGVPRRGCLCVCSLGCSKSIQTDDGMSRVLGWYYHQMAQASYPDTNAAIGHLRNSAGAYLNASDRYPEDDEHHVCEWIRSCWRIRAVTLNYWAGYLCVALDNMFKCGCPLRETTEIMKRIRISAPKMRKIWVQSALARGGRDMKIAQVEQFEREVTEHLEKGTLTMDDRVHPQMS